MSAGLGELAGFARFRSGANGTQEARIQGVF